MERACSALEQKNAAAAMEEKQILDKLWDSYGLTVDSAQPLRQELESHAKATRRMLRDVLNAYEARDVDLARDVVAYDDVVDDYFHKTKNNLADMLKKAGDDDEATDYVLDLLMVDKYYERIGDHIVMIAEAVEYNVTNQVVK